MGLKESGLRGSLRNVSVGIDAIPDSAIAQYDATQESFNDGDSVSTFADQIGTVGDLTAGTAPTYKTDIINGNAVVRFDGVDDFLDVVKSSSVSQKVAFAFVVNYGNVGDNPIVFDHASSDEPRIFADVNRDGNDDTRFNAGSNLSSSDNVVSNGTTAVLVYIADGSNSEIRVDGSSVASGDAGTNAFQSLRVGSNQFDDAFADYDVGEIMVYDSPTSSEISSEESRLGNKWGVAV